MENLGAPTNDNELFILWKNKYLNLPIFYKQKEKPQDAQYEIRFLAYKGAPHSGQPESSVDVINKKIRSN